MLCFFMNIRLEIHDPVITTGSCTSQGHGSGNDESAVAVVAILNSFASHFLINPHLLIAVSNQGLCLFLAQRDCLTNVNKRGHGHCFHCDGCKSTENSGLIFHFVD